MLFDKIKIGNIELKNRVVMSPMCMYGANDDGMVRDFHIEHYATRAAGGVGLVITEAAAVSPDGRISHHDLGIWSDEHISSLRDIVKRVHSYDCKIGIQLAHAGRKSEATLTPLAPSPLRFSENFAIPKELSLEGLMQVKQQFIQATKRAIDAGFDVIEVHGAHGYLINQILSPLTNKREDRYGGSFENRARFLLELIEEIRVFYKGVLFIRLSAVDYEDEILSIKESVLLSKCLNDLGVDLIDVSSGGNSPKPPTSVFAGYQVEYAKIIKESAGIKTSAVGMINSYELAEDILQTKSADLIFLARELLRNPYWAVNIAKQHENRDIMLKSYSRAY